MTENHLLSAGVYFPSSTSASEPGSQGSLAVRAKGACLLLVGPKGFSSSPAPRILRPIMHIKAARIRGRIRRLKVQRGRFACLGLMLISRGRPSVCNMVHCVAGSPGWTLHGSAPTFSPATAPPSSRARISHDSAESGVGIIGQAWNTIGLPDLTVRPISAVSTRGTSPRRRPLNFSTVCTGNRTVSVDVQYGTCRSARGQLSLAWISLT